jgi:cell division septum initiation protein DivIVA
MSSGEEATRDADPSTIAEGSDAEPSKPIGGSGPPAEQRRRQRELEDRQRTAQLERQRMQRALEAAQQDAQRRRQEAERELEDQQRSAQRERQRAQRELEDEQGTERG